MIRATQNIPAEETMLQDKKVRIRTEECIQCGNCYGGLPDVFGSDDDGTAFVHNPKGALDDEIQQSLENCSASCIEWAESPKKP